jgi:hypothetical protein
LTANKTLSHFKIGLKYFSIQYITLDGGETK